MTITIIPSEMILFRTPCKCFRAWVNSLFSLPVLCNSEHSSICLLKFNTLEVKMSFPGTRFFSELFIQAFPSLSIQITTALQVKLTDGSSGSNPKITDLWVTSSPPQVFISERISVRPREGGFFLLPLCFAFIDPRSACYQKKKRHGPLCRKKKNHSFPFFHVFGCLVWSPSHAQKALACKR